MTLEIQTNTSRVLIERIEHYVQTKTNGMVRDLVVDVLDNQVILTGRSATYYTKQLATHAVLNAVKDVALTNDIEVM
ncbi:MAG: hypothetical protein IID45_09865 [Planctomycetes bacterium]|nr:hypothetical protein [Planctomycetota bacterium]